MACEGAGPPSLSLPHLGAHQVSAEGSAARGLLGPPSIRPVAADCRHGRAKSGAVVPPTRGRPHVHGGTPIAVEQARRMRPWASRPRAAQAAHERRPAMLDVVVWFMVG